MLIVWLLLLNTAWVVTKDPTLSVRLWSINLFSAVFSVLLLARILQRPEASNHRRIAGIIHDNLAVTAWLYTCGPAGALALFVYPFVTVGNGFRFGVRHLAWSGGLGAIGLGILVATAPGWASFGLIGVGVLISHIVVTLYTGVLLRHLYQARDQLAILASCDALTGLPNRRYFLDRLTHMVKARDRRQVACLYLDLDGFKAVNDRCGHRVGDHLLRRVAEALRGCIRASDLLARLGGDEFTVVLDGPVGRDEVRALAERIITAIEAITRVDGQPINISASIGISTAPAGDAETPVLPEDLLRAADEALYVAKRSGGGQCRFAEDLLASTTPTGPIAVGAGGHQSPTMPVAS